MRNGVDVVRERRRNKRIFCAYNKQTNEKKYKNIEIIIKLNDNWDDLWLLFEGNMTTLK